ncbi:MAG: hypothetical protein PHD45_08715 [Bacteroidales bacterium]|nr:hypothetical protein [Bacteroidales bacterium]
MINKIRKSSYLLSSNWYKRYKLPYLLLVFDIFLVIIFALFSIKDYLVGHFDRIYPYEGLLILVIVSILLIIRFNISLLMFSKQKFGLYLSILFLLATLSIEMIFGDLNSPFMLVFESVVVFINNFLISLPDFINTSIVYSFYILSIYGPFIYYITLNITKKNLLETAKPFDILTGFYGSTISKKLKIADMVVYSFLIGVAMMIGLVANHINWIFLSVPLSLHAIYEFFKRMHFPKITKKKKLVIYTTTFIISTLVIYTQRIPYVGLITFCFSIVFMLILLITMSKSYTRSIVVTLYTFILIPVFCMGYNLFAYPQYGIVKKSVPYEDEKIFFHIVDQDGYYGFRNRRLKIIRPAYNKIVYCDKNRIHLLNKNLQWETYNIPEDKTTWHAKRIDIFNKKRKNYTVK